MLELFVILEEEESLEKEKIAHHVKESKLIIIQSIS